MSYTGRPALRSLISISALFFHLHSYSCSYRQTYLLPLPAYRSGRVNRDPREGQQQFRFNPNGVGDRTTTLRRLLIVNWSRFSQGMTRLMSCWPDEKRYLCPLQFIVVSLLLSLVSTLLFSRTGGVLSHPNSSTNRFPRFPPRNLCSLITLALCSLVFAATDTASC